MRQTTAYEPEIAAAKLAAGEVLLVSLADVARWLGIHPRTFLPYLRSGELTAYKLEDVEIAGLIDPDKIALASDELVSWMARHDLFSPAKGAA